MPLQFTYHGQSIANFIDKEAEDNEDSILMNISGDQYSRFVICDGAGGAGVFSRDWANFLCNSIPEKPETISIKPNDWFLKTAESFHDTVIINKDLSDLFLNKKVYSDGSYSTLCICWIDPSESKIFYAGLGDTILFIFCKRENDYELKDMFPLEKDKQFKQNPDLINWINPLGIELPIREYYLNSKFIIVIASDSLANWIILNLHLVDPTVLSFAGVSQGYLNSLSQGEVLIYKEAITRGTGVKPIKSLLEFLSEMSSSELCFEESMKLLFENGEVEIDDYSLINIQGDVS